MTDVFLEGLKADWRRQTVDLDQVRQRLIWRRWRTAFFIVAEVLGVGLALGFAISLLANAPSLGLAVSWLAVAAMFASAVLGLWTITRLRGLRTRAQAEPSGPHAALLAMCMQLDNLDRIARYWTQSAMLLAACALAVGALYALGHICLYAAGVAGVSWLGVAAVLAIAAAWRRRRNSRERAACQAMLRVYAGAETE